MYIGKWQKCNTVFYGTFRDGQIHRGCIISQEQIFEGVLKSRNRQFGIFITNYVLYRGSLLNNQAHGNWYLRESNGLSYEGEFKNQYSDGLGTQTFDGQSYSGMWVQGQPNGKIVIKYPQFYGQQEFVNGIMHGHGQIIQKVGSIEILQKQIIKNNIFTSIQIFRDQILVANGARFGDKFRYTYVNGQIIDVDIPQDLNAAMNMQKVKYCNPNADAFGSFHNLNDTGIITYNHESGPYKGEYILNSQGSWSMKIGDIDYELHQSCRFSVQIGRTRETGRITTQGLKLDNGMYFDVKDFEILNTNPRDILTQNHDYQMNLRIPEPNLKGLYNIAPHHSKQVYCVLILDHPPSIAKGLIMGNQVHGYALLKNNIRTKLGQFAFNELIFGTQVLPNGVIYSGQLLKDYPHGDSVYIINNGSCTIEGKWLNGLNGGYQTLNTKSERYKGHMIIQFQEVEKQYNISQGSNNSDKNFDLQSLECTQKEEINSKLHDTKEIEFSIDKITKLDSFVKWMENTMKQVFINGSFLYQLRQEVYYTGENFIKHKNAMGTYLLGDRILHVGSVSFKNIQHEGVSRTSIINSKQGQFICYSTCKLLQDEGQSMVRTKQDDYKYVGQGRQQTKHGEGVFINENAMYCGGWVNNQREGFGIEIIFRQERYEGLWKNDKRHGKGIIYRQDWSFEVEYNEGHPYIVDSDQ